MPKLGIATAADWTIDAALEVIETIAIGLASLQSDAFGAWTDWDGDTGAQPDFSSRQLIPASQLSVGGETIKLTLRSSQLSGFDLDKIYIGHASVGGNAWDFDGNQKEVTFSGTSGVSIAQDSTEESDEITFKLDSSKDLIIAVDIGSGANTRYRRDAVASGFSFYDKAGSNEASCTTPAGFSTTANVLFFVEKVVSGYSSSSPVAESPWIAIDYTELDGTTALAIAENKIAAILGFSTGSIKYQYATNGGAYNGSWVTQATMETALQGLSITNATQSVRIKAQFISDGSQAADIVVPPTYIEGKAGTAGGGDEVFMDGGMGM